MYQHYNKLYVYGTRDRYDVIDDLNIPFDRSLEMRRGKAAEAALLSHREGDTVVGYSMGGSVALSLSEKYNVKTKTINTPVVAMNAHPIVKTAINKGISGLTGAVGGSIGGAIDASIRYTDDGFFTEGLSRAGGKLGDELNKSIEKK